MSSNRQTRPQPPESPAPRSGVHRAHEANLAIPREEEGLCRHVVEHLTTLSPARPQMRRVEDEALLSLRDQIATARLEDVPALMAAMERVHAVASSRSQQLHEPVDAASPYFGHLRLAEAQRGVRDVLIGKTTYIEPRRGIRIVDWRHAPVSQLYYRYDEGASYEEVFGDREVEGTVVVRRTVTIQDGQLQRVTAPQGTFIRTGGGWRRHDLHDSELAGGQGSAVRAEHLRGVLGGGLTEDQREDRHLPEIAALLDPRQFEVITRPDSGLVVIQGGAGSGKTTIGVHRMAYLAYQASSRFAADKMLVVVGTPALRAYISELLRALDRSRVMVVTFAEWARRARRRCFRWLRPPVEDNTPAEVSRLKTDPVVLRLLHEQAAQLGGSSGRSPARTALWLWAEVLTNRERLLQAFEQQAAEHGRPARLSPEQINRAWGYCADRCPAVVEWSPEDAAEADEEAELVEGIDGVMEELDERAALDPEDDALLLRAYQLVAGRLPLQSKISPAVVEHLFVDEAQDLAPVDLAVLVSLTSEQKSITLAGDTAQRLKVDTGFAEWSAVLDNLDLSHVNIEPLRIAYRSTRQVLEVATAILGPLADPEPPLAPRTGAPVEHHSFPGQGAAVAFLAQNLRPLFSREPRATVAVLARYPEQADAYYEALRMAEVPYLRRVSDYDFAFRPGVEITEINQVKGLEYDYVVMVDVNASTYPVNDESRYQLHVGTTRAAHQLWLISSGPPAALIPRSLLAEGAV